MSFRVVVRHAAERDIAEAQNWYETQQVGLGAQFYDETMRVFDLLVESPLVYPVVHRNVRRAVLRRFPFLVWYRVADQTVRVLAITHGMRRPSSALARLQ